MARYSPEPEQFFLAGLDATAMRKRRRKVCAARKFKYEWLRIDPCVEMVDPDEQDVPKIQSSRSLVDFLHDAVPFAGRGVEYLMVVCCDNQLQVRAVAVPHKGGRSSSILDPTVVLQAVLLSGSSAFFIAHNHPSGVSRPSDEDVAITQRLLKGSPYIGLQFLDHLVVTDNPRVYFSFMDNGMMETR